MGLTNTPLFKSSIKTRKHFESLTHSATRFLVEIAVEEKHRILTGRRKTCPYLNEDGNINKLYTVLYLV